MRYFSNVSCSGSRWVIERRVAGTKQVSTVGHLLPDPSPLSFLDSSSALSPWTTYQYRLVLHNQAGNTTGKVLITCLSKSKFSLTKKGLVLQLLNCTKMFVVTGPWVNITTRPSRPAGLSPPRVKVLGPATLQVRATFF